jgi:glycosyltransferase involved in cell wall biosynthesis
MSTFPNVLFFRYDTYSYVDALLKSSEEECTFHIVSHKDFLNLLFDTKYPILVTFGPNESEYWSDVHSVICDRMKSRWIHYTEIKDLKDVYRGIQYCFINTVLKDREVTRPIFSAFTTCYNSYDKIKRPYTSLKNQTLVDWEWVILDDSPEDTHFDYLRKLTKGDTRVRLYKRSENSGNIGNVKNEAASLCRGKYVLELDHDDEIVPELFTTVLGAFTAHPEVGFVYTDFINIYESGENYWYGDFMALGYGAYYCEKYDGKWRNVYVTPQVNNITMRHLVSMPNHPRIWRRDILFALGNYSEFLPINDDQELLLQTCLKTKMLKIPMLGYIQYMNSGNSNFSLIRNRDINRLGPRFLTPQFYEKHKFHSIMKARGGYDDEKYMHMNERVWLRDSYVPSYSSILYQPKYDTQYLILSRQVFLDEYPRLRDLKGKNDFFLMDASGDFKGLCSFLDAAGFSHAKCYSIKDLTEEQMINYFNYIYKSCENTVILKPSGTVVSTTSSR